MLWLAMEIVEINAIGFDAVHDIGFPNKNRKIRLGIVIAILLYTVNSRAPIMGDKTGLQLKSNLGDKNWRQGC